jgi:hypothetical protein
MTTSDPLDQVFVKTEEVVGEQRALLAQLIFPYAAINPETGEVHFKATADDLSAKQKILVYLLCRLALSTRPNTNFTATVSPIEITKDTMLKGGTVRPNLMDLVNQNVVAKSGDGYYVAPIQLHRAKNILPTE